VLGDALGGEAPLEQRLQPIVLGRVHADEHRLLQLKRQDRVLQHGEPSELGGEGLPVAADLMHVVSRRHRPEAILVGVLAYVVGPVDRALAAKPPKQLERRPVLEIHPIADAHLIERRLILAGLAGGAHDLPSPSRLSCRCSSSTAYPITQTAPVEPIPGICGQKMRRSRVVVLHAC
jgi:hypothetical protein